jgi:ankyrin repeat protein
MLVPKTENHDKGDPSLVKLLLSKGAEINAEDKAGKTALQLAILYKRSALIKLLQTQGAH